ncbi:MAG TPA: 3-dehydroquinate synthase [Bacillota bacterium]
MEEIIVQSSFGPYPIYIGENIRFQLNTFLTKNYSAVLIISDDKVAPLYIDDVRNQLNCEVYVEVIPEGESSKNIETYYELQTKAIQYGLDRESVIIALGGGVVGDLAGFVASTFMRGIDFIQMPTTILAHDSSVGGKVAINHELGKNLIGSFYSPKMVIYDVNTLETLSSREVRSGYAELMKEALISDRAFFETLLQTNLHTIKVHQLIKHLNKGILIKKDIVEQDEKESGKRKFLNLGHTLAHALEAELGYGKITHGEAVAIGLLFTFYVSEQTYGVKLPTEPLLQWLQKNNYPLQINNVEAEKLLLKMKSDKKATHDHIQMVLLQQVEQPIAVTINDDTLHGYIATFLQQVRR